MARIALTNGTLVGRRLMFLTGILLNASSEINRVKAIADQITNNGADKTLLESSTEALIPAGQGAAIYAGITQIKTALDGLATLVSAIDQG